MCYDNKGVGLLARSQYESSCGRVPFHIHNKTTMTFFYRPDLNSLGVRDREGRTPLNLALCRWLGPNLQQNEKTFQRVIRFGQCKAQPFILCQFYQNINFVEMCLRNDRNLILSWFTSAVILSRSSKECQAAKQLVEARMTEKLAGRCHRPVLPHRQLDFNKKEKHSVQ